MGEVPNGAIRLTVAVIWFACICLVLASIDTVPDPPATKDGPGATQCKLIENAQPALSGNERCALCLAEIGSRQTWRPLELLLLPAARPNAPSMRQAADPSPPHFAA